MDEPVFASLMENRSSATVPWSFAVLKKGVAFRLEMDRKASPRILTTKRQVRNDELF
jgi:hypothetical protein